MSLLDSPLAPIGETVPFAPDVPDIQEPDVRDADMLEMYDISRYSGLAQLALEDVETELKAQFDQDWPRIAENDLYYEFSKTDHERDNRKGEIWESEKNYFRDGYALASALAEIAKKLRPDDPRFGIVKDLHGTELIGHTGMVRPASGVLEHKIFSDLNNEVEYRSGFLSDVGLNSREVKKIVRDDKEVEIEVEIDNNFAAMTAEPLARMPDGVADPALFISSHTVTQSETGNEKAVEDPKITAFRETVAKYSGFMVLGAKDDKVELDAVDSKWAIGMRISPASNAWYIPPGKNS